MLLVATVLNDDSYRNLRSNCRRVAGESQASEWGLVYSLGDPAGID